MIAWVAAFLAATGFALFFRGLGIESHQRAAEPAYLELFALLAATIAAPCAAALAVVGFQAAAVLAARR